MARGTYELAGKVALITGGARGIGLEAARALHRRGASIALVDLDDEETTRVAAGIDPNRAVGFAADATDPAALATAVEETAARFGGLDVCVANAGIAPAGATVRVMDPNAFERVVEVNLLGVWRTVRAALPQIVERRGHVVLVSSVYAFMNGVLVTPYAAAKAGVEQLGRALRLELAPHGASASVAYFGFVETEMVKQGIDEDALLGKRFEEKFPKALRRRIPASEAGEAIARGIERRAPRIIAPRRWAPWSVLRGVINPLADARLERDAEALEIIRDGDVEGRVAGREIVAQPSPKSTNVPSSSASRASGS